MPGLARKLLIFAAIDGLILQPASSKGQKQQLPVKLRYGDAAVSGVTKDSFPDLSQPDSSFEAFGLVGLVTVSKLSYLISITRRKQVATIFGFPVYVITEVAVTPCASQAEAAESVRQTSRSLKVATSNSLSDDSEASDTEDTASIGTVPDDVDDIAVEEVPDSPNTTKSTFAEDVMRRRGSYGRFAQSWFSKSGWTLEQKKQMGLSVSPTVSPKPTKEALAASPTEPPVGAKSEAPERPSALLPKLLRTIKVLFGSSRSFYFSYDVDLTRRLTSDSVYASSDTVPLRDRVDETFFWNHNILKPFFNAAQDSLSLPLMQGFVGQRGFTVDSDPPQKDTSKESLELRGYQSSHPGSPPLAGNDQPKQARPTERNYIITLISRRSTKRAGLRYLRRGIDENGFVANMVETEQILAPKSWQPASRTYSFVQIRGSIPLFFTQSPYSLKPAPVLQHNNDANLEACRLHLDRLTRKYGQVQIVNLVEKHGIEEPVGTRYERIVNRYKEESPQGGKISFEWFDFHQVCRGMKFENVSQLLSILKDKLRESGSTVREDGKTLSAQNGVIRTNCMDCLDRTNVCQSSFGKHMLEAQLVADGIDVSAQLDQEAAWFNTLWADNGDAISKQYASTSAMKGDYTRTKKRNYRGALNDLSLSLARFYSGMVNDYFSQTAIDFFLNNVNDKVFDEFEADMMTKDPAMSVSKMREQAIDLCRHRVVANVTEEFHGGWVLASPSTSNTVKPWPMEQVVLLLTDVALYLCRFDWNMDKVSSFERVNLAQVTHIKFGTYITSTVSAAQTDELRNVGFVITYQPGKGDVKRTNTRTLSTAHGTVEASHDDGQGQDKSNATPRPRSWVSFLAGKAKGPVTKSLAFKAPYRDTSVTATDSKPQQTEIQQVVTICAEVERLSFDAQIPSTKDEHRGTMIERGDIISLETAQQNTTILEQLGYSLKRLVWA